MASQAFSGIGTIFSKKVGSNYVPLAEINNLANTKNRPTTDVTNLDSTGGYMEFIPGPRDAGSLSGSMNFSKAAYGLMNDDFESSTVQDYRIVLPDTSNTQFDFQGYVVSLDFNVNPEKVESGFEIKVTGPVTMTS